MGYNPYVGKNPNNFIKDFFDAKEAAEKRAREKEQYNLDKTNRENLINAIKGGNQEEIDTAFATYSPADYINRQQKLADIQERKDWQLKMADIAHQRDLEKLGIANTNAVNLANLKSNLDRISNGYPGMNVNGIELTGNKTYDEAVLKQAAKDSAERQSSLRQMEEMSKPLDLALTAAKNALQDGEGIGASSARSLLGDNKTGISGFLGQVFSTEKGDTNRADVETANKQMNSFLRAKLASTGLTGGELNAAAEAEAYRYSISPNDSPAIIKRKIENFERDYLGKTSNEPKVGESRNINGFTVTRVK